MKWVRALAQAMFPTDRKMIILLHVSLLAQRKLCLATGDQNLPQSDDPLATIWQTIAD
jgi:hypothetical protein